MDASKRLLSLLMLMSITEWRSVSETSRTVCTDMTRFSYKLVEGEAYYFVPYIFNFFDPPSDNVTWYKVSPEMENITSDENQNIHSHGAALFLLNVSTDDSGDYMAKESMAAGKCYIYPLKIDVFSKTSGEDVTFGSIKNSDQTKRIPCPDHVNKTCVTFKGSFTWYKGTDLLQGEHKDNLFVYEATKEHEDIYSCVCTWTHHHNTYNTSGSRKLIHSEMVVYRKIEILSPTTNVQLADKGVGIKLNCSVLCGTNVKRDCAARWEINGQPVQHMDGYNQTTKVVIEKDSHNSIFTAVLTIERVSAKDFQNKFKCIGVELYTNHNVTLTLKQRESVVPLVVGGVCVFLTCVFAAVLIRFFAIDLALFFRPYLPQKRHNEVQEKQDQADELMACLNKVDWSHLITCVNDARLYDAYVVYQTQKLDRDTEDKICHFVSAALPSVLEDKCGYQLFIQGRDDIPGEDRLELVERCLRQSRRLMVILTPGSKPESEITDKCPASNQTSVIGGFDWQVGLHHALVQREMSVILIQLGDTGTQGYTHLPLGLQHLIRKSAPIRWPEGTRGATAWNSHFWKRVRYLMPATPAKKCDLSAVI